MPCHHSSYSPLEIKGYPTTLNTLPCWFISSSNMGTTANPALVRLLVGWARNILQRRDCTEAIRLYHRLSRRGLIPCRLAFRHRCRDVSPHEFSLARYHSYFMLPLCLLPPLMRSGFAWVRRHGSEYVVSSLRYVERGSKG